MRSALEHLPIDGQVVIGAGGDEDETLGRGQRVGAGGEQVDLAVDPLEGRGVVARKALAHVAQCEASVLRCWHCYRCRR